MLFGIIFGILFYHDNVRKKFSFSRFILFLIIIGAPLGMTDFVRGNSLKNFLSDITKVKVVLPTSKPFTESDEYQFSGRDKQDYLALQKGGHGHALLRKAGSILFSNKIFCSHMSMYGALNYDIPPTYGTSFVFLAESFIPRIISDQRSPGIYEYYALQVNAEPGQGYTINHITGWYLNFGFAGILLGAILIGFLWGYGYIIRTYNATVHFTFLRILYFIFPIGFTAYMPVLIRAGPECFKSLLFEGILMPALVIFFGYFGLKRKSG